jgi:signal transduction histidine kinase
MRLSIKGKQVAGVTSIVGLAVVVLSGLHLTSLARLAVEESVARAELLANVIYHRAREVVAVPDDGYAAFRADAGLRSILESSAYSRDVTFAALVDTRGIVIAHSDAAKAGQALAPLPKLATLLEQGAIAQLRVIYGQEGRTFEIERPLLMDGVRFGSIRVGVSMPLLKGRGLMEKPLKQALQTAVGALVGALLVAMLLAQVLLRPIHVIRSGLTRLGRGEFGVAVNLPQQDEFGDLGGFFNTVSAQLSADRSELAGQKANLESVVEHLEDAVAMFTPDGELLFANPAMREELPPESSARTLSELLPPDHPYRKLVEQTLRSGQSCGPLSATVPRRAAAESGSAGSPAAGERLILTNVITGRDGRPVGIMLVARNLGYLGEVQSTLNYSRKLAALGRLSAGVAHEIRNPLNATMIHLELLKQRLSVPVVSHADGDPAGRTAGPDVAAALGHAAIIAGEMRRLDEVVQGFLKFARPEDLKLQAVSLCRLVEQVVAVIAEDARKQRVEIHIECPLDLPALRGDPGMLHQAFLNLVLNAVQAMPEGGRLRIAGAAVADSRVEVVFEDTGVGITPEHLDRIFDLYFTTKGVGSGIGLSVVYRTVQLHDGEIEVRSTLGHGTVFRLLLPRAQAPYTRSLFGS